MNSSRRDFFKLCALTGLGVACPGGVLGAAPRDDSPYEGPYYLVFNAAGGWDTTYLMDPKGINEMNRLYKEGDIQTHGAHKFAPTAAHIQAGMSNEDFFKEFGSGLLTLNGLDYSVNNHEPGSRYMATGKLDSLAYPTFAALVAACKGPQCPLGFLTFGGYSNTGNLIAMSRVPYANSLRKLANADFQNGEKGAPYHDDFVVDRIERALAEQAAERVPEKLLPRLDRAQSMLYAGQLNSKSLSRVIPWIPATLAKDSLSQCADIALAAFKAGVGVSANLSHGTFDSHANNDVDQMLRIPELLAGIAYALRRAEELKIRDKLVVVVQSEMGRTPTYNKGNGKDHWSIGSIMFIGPGIQGDRVIGATDEKQFHIPLNPATLACDKEKGIRVRPEHIHEALREYAGIADHPMSKKFPLITPDKPRIQGLWG